MLDTFTQAYINCALWSTNDVSDEHGGDPLDDNYDVGDFDPATLARMVADCKHFQEENEEDITTYLGCRSPVEMAGQDFWLTRNGHGVGFWDSDWPEDVGKRLTEASEAYGEVYLYVENGKIYC